MFQPGNNSQLLSWSKASFFIYLFFSVMQNLKQRKSFKIYFLLFSIVNSSLSWPPSNLPKTCIVYFLAHYFPRSALRQENEKTGSLLVFPALAIPLDFRLGHPVTYLATPQFVSEAAHIQHLSQTRLSFPYP